MTDEEQNLTPARPVAPRRRLPANPQMAQPMRRPLEPAPETHVVEEPTTSDVEPQPEQVVDVAPVPETVSPVQPVEELVVEPPDVAEPPTAPAPPEPPATEVPVVTPPAIVETPPVAATPAPAETAPEPDFPRTMRDTVRRVDESWAKFRAAAMRFPQERMDEHIAEDSWTRKQMLEHVAAWHDLTADRLLKLINTGTPAPLDRDTDQFNAAVARQAIGKTSGEVLKDMDATFNRLRRQLVRLTDAQLEADDWWAAWVIGGNTYGHYEEHWADVYTPELPAGGRARR